MSYCRFSSDDFRSDVYVYEHVFGGIAIHVAGNKPRGWIPRIWKIPHQHIVIDDQPATRWERLRYKLHLWAFLTTYRLQQRYLRLAPRRFYTDRPFAGESFYGLSYDEAIERLMELEEYGYRVPDGVINRLMDDEREQLKEKS